MGSLRPKGTKCGVAFFDLKVRSVALQSAVHSNPADKKNREPEGSPIILFSCIRGAVTVDHQIAKPHSDLGQRLQRHTLEERTDPVIYFHYFTAIS